MSEVEEFLLDETTNDKTFDAPYKSITIHKEKFNDRFTYIYTKDHYDYLYNNEYRLSSYLDLKSKTLYDIDYYLDKVVDGSNNLKTSTFKDVENEIINNIGEYIEKYSLDHANELKKEFNEEDNWYLNNYQKDVRKLFIEYDEPAIKLDRFYNISGFTSSKEFHQKKVLNEYLDNKDATIKKYAFEIINDNKKELGLALKLYDKKNNYLYKIKTNERKFKDLYVNKRIYDSIKNEHAKTLTFTIKYNNKEMTFKGDYEKFKRSILNDDRGTYFFNSSYDKVSDFIKENTGSNNRWKEDFLFSHVTSITYGKNKLYTNDFVKNKKAIDRDER